VIFADKVLTGDKVVVGCIPNRTSVTALPPEHGLKFAAKKATYDGNAQIDHFASALKLPFMWSPAGLQKALPSIVLYRYLD